MKEKEIAILMAAGLGSRLEPLTNTVPKPLVKIHGVSMIETIIAGLVERGVEKIYVITGYRKEQFSYLAEKYDRIELIENPEYREKNNISSLYAAGDILGSADCFICETDLYVTHREIFQLPGEESCYFGKRKAGCSEEWGLQIREGRISHIGKDCDNAYDMAGISYWRKRDAAKIRKAIEKAYGEAGHEQLFWDEVVNQNLDKIKAVVLEIPDDSVQEIDTMEELGRIDETYAK